jgi:hypothetical protein
MRLDLPLKQTDRLRMQLAAVFRDFRIGELRKLLATHKQDPDFQHSCQSWRKELLALREEEARPWELSSKERNQGVHNTLIRGSTNAAYLKAAKKMK